MKTLKEIINCKGDLERQEGGNCKKCGTNHTITFEKLKQDAIDDIKLLQEAQNTMPPGVKDRLVEGKIAYAKQKFNITEEDLSD